MALKAKKSPAAKSAGDEPVTPKPKVLTKEQELAAYREMLLIRRSNGTVLQPTRLMAWARIRQPAEEAHHLPIRLPPAALTRCISARSLAWVAPSWAVVIPAWA